MCPVLPVAVVLGFWLALEQPFSLLIYCPILSVATTAVRITYVCGGLAGSPRWRLCFWLCCVSSYESHTVFRRGRCDHLCFRHKKMEAGRATGVSSHSLWELDFSIWVQAAWAMWGRFRFDSILGNFQWQCDERPRWNGKMLESFEVCCNQTCLGCVSSEVKDHSRSL